MLMAIALIGVFLLASCFTCKAWLEGRKISKREHLTGRTVDISPRIAHQLIMEQVRLWNYSGTKTGAYYAQQHNWTVRARTYVAQLKSRIQDNEAND